MDQERFTALLAGAKGPVERFVHLKLPTREDAEDLLQEIYLTAYEKCADLQKETSFAAWLLSIARNKCRDFYRRRIRRPEISLEALPESALEGSRFGLVENSLVEETLFRLPLEDRRLLYLYFFQDLPQAEIARRLHIPLGTVKSRLYHAKKRFRDRYPCPPLKGDQAMKTLPEFLPDYRIEPLNIPPFPVRWEEMMGWFLVPKLGETLSFGMYDFPQKKRTDWISLEVTGKAEVHGIQGVEIAAHEHTADGALTERRFVAQLTDTHCRILAESHMDGDVRKFFTFLDGEDFLPNWGFGEDNCGNEVSLVPKGCITREGSAVRCRNIPEQLDVVGCYKVTVGGKSYETICVMDIEQYDSGVATEQFLDREGRTVLWRRFNRNDWAFHRYGQLWTDKLPQNERLTINGETYVHWYDCITDYIL